MDAKRNIAKKPDKIVSRKSSKLPKGDTLSVDYSKKHATITIGKVEPFIVEPIATATIPTQQFIAWMINELKALNLIKPSTKPSNRG